MTSSKLSTAEQVKTIWTLGGLPFRQFLKKVFAGINNDDLIERAGDLAFNFVLALFPLMIFLLAVLGLTARGGTLRTHLFSYFSSVLPPAAAQLVNHTMQQVMRNATNAKVLYGIVLSLWFASGGMTSMISGLNGVYEVKEERSWFKVRAVALALTIAIAILVIVALVVVLAGGYLANLVGNQLSLHSLVVIWKIAEWPVAITFITFSFSLIYYFAPDLHEQHWYWITPGSVVGVVLWIGASFAFRAYLHFFNSYSRTYGSLGAVMILLMWLYVTGFAFLVGGEINAQIEHAAAHHGHPEAKAPGEKEAA